MLVRLIDMYRFDSESICAHPNLSANILENVDVKISFDNKDAVQIIQSTAKSIPFFEALEALWQRDIKPLINTRDEYKRRQLTIKF